MAKKNQAIKQSGTRRFVQNTSSMKLEIIVGVGVVTILPKQVVEIPSDFIVPKGIGLVEK